MDDKGDYPSDSDQNDDEYLPGKAEESEISEKSESDYDGVDGGSSGDPDESAEKNKKGKTKKRRKKQRKEIKASLNSSSQSRSPTGENGREDPADDEQEKKRADALWADFLKDTDSTPKEVKPVTNSTASSSTSKMKVQPSPSHTPKESRKLEITEIFDFAGEKVEVTKQIDADSIAKQKAVVNSAEKSKPSPFNRLPVAKRPSTGGLSSILGQINKKNKISVLEKSKLDWNKFKSNEGLNEELQTFNKGKDGYLERQDFLERTDLRQFEIEKNLRQTKRSNR